MTPTPETLRAEARRIEEDAVDTPPIEGAADGLGDGVRAHAAAWQAEIDRRLNCEAVIREKEARLLEVERAAKLYVQSIEVHADGDSRRSAYQTLRRLVGGLT